VALPNPLPDNPQRWEGWRNYNSEDPYARLCLDFELNPTNEQVEENCRIILVWWQKKLPLKNQPSNPVAQMLRAGLDEAPQFIAEARTVLLDPEARSEVDRGIREKIVAGATAEFKKIMPFAIRNHQLASDGEERLYEEGAKLGLATAELKNIIEAELIRLGVTRAEIPPEPAPAPAIVAPAAAAGEVVRGDAFEEFRRVLKLSRLCLDGEELTDDQRDALCNMGESLGLTGGQAEDMIDEYLEEVSNAAPVPLKPAAAPGARGAVAAVARPAPTLTPGRPTKAPAPVPTRPAPREAPPEPMIVTSPMLRLQERQKHPNFKSKYGPEMLLVTSGEFMQGSEAPDAAPHEQPTMATAVTCFHISRFPITNAQYELFDPTHATKRPPWADDNHPAVYVNAREAASYCSWLAQREGLKYRLPTEAEWEYAARGTDTRRFPWGERLDAGHYANFADVRTTFAWRDPNIDDGYAETAPVGKFPKGASPFGVEDMAGNVFEWCLDYFDSYRPSKKQRLNPRGPMNGSKRVYRGGSWKSRASSLRTTSRAFNLGEYSSNDVGFRVVSECEPVV
jgi:formylglycine-generating enzyme required for sulfatase activity